MLVRSALLVLILLLDGVRAIPTSVILVLVLVLVLKLLLLLAGVGALPPSVVLVRCPFLRGDLWCWCCFAGIGAGTMPPSVVLVRCPLLSAHNGVHRHRHAQMPLCSKPHQYNTQLCNSIPATLQCAAQLSCPP